MMTQYQNLYYNLLTSMHKIIYLYTQLSWEEQSHSVKVVTD